ncbi:hypothetical protein HBI56_034980 [Parastagonospora nodorum]|uniref:Uncharacterized protein n=1 Tax=Phaeosphaeria nodorum (strain SN15 / ATCC MYA-4574 / FGSC 10173) TaxID=321614 RepID=A0A7U2F2S5_PHANO|nr:hypothetical protein HBH56_022790 [Parastagonospora nodorum]QRC95615.1 hypothetical protein JI435_407620 [Parastagonospora nodorum SN15]KAH3937578.1 hypothetical protein HBH54_011670 [Parastagonospora nodorum]KAH3944143.1 hypothetical protein HBH53_165040 [Parastagonospora nodorum]KAH3967483.1 hypothetical protein HBH51_135120 [Parastagonospora nodorum]
MSWAVNHGRAYAPSALVTTPVPVSCACACVTGTPSSEHVLQMISRCRCRSETTFVNTQGCG